MNQKNSVVAIIFSLFWKFSAEDAVSSSPGFFWINYESTEMDLDRL